MTKIIEQITPYTGNRQPEKLNKGAVPIENKSYNILKIILLTPFGFSVNLVC